MLYIDTYNTNKLYKCNYEFNVLSPFDKWIYVENGIPAKESQNIINNKDITIINREYNANVGSIWWDYSINETNNTLIGVDMHEENATEVDSTLNVIIKPNFSPRISYAKSLTMTSISNGLKLLLTKKPKIIKNIITVNPKNIPT